MCSLGNYTGLQLNWFTQQGCVRLYNIQFNATSQKVTIQHPNNVLVSQTYDTVCFIFVQQLI